MTTTTTTYADAVRRALDDLPAARYLELVDGLDEHLAEVRAEGESLDDLLGAPEAYAAELRASAGLPPRGDGSAPLPPPTPVPSMRSRLVIAVQRHHLARGVLAIGAFVLVLVALANADLSAAGLCAIVAGVFALAWVVRRVLGAAGLSDATMRRATTGLTIGTVVLAAVLGSHYSTRSTFRYPDRGGIVFDPAGAVAMPDLRGMSTASALETARRWNLDPISRGTGDVVTDQSPAPGTMIVAGSQIVLTAVPSTTTALVPPTAAPPAPATGAPLPSTTTPATTTTTPATSTATAAPTTAQTNTTATATTAVPTAPSTAP